MLIIYCIWADVDYICCLLRCAKLFLVSSSIPVKNNSQFFKTKFSWTSNIPLQIIQGGHLILISQDTVDVTNVETFKEHCESYLSGTETSETLHHWTRGRYITRRDISRDIMGACNQCGCQDTKVMLFPSRSDDRMFASNRTFRSSDLEGNSITSVSWHPHWLQAPMISRDISRLVMYLPRVQWCSVSEVSVPLR